MATEAQIAANRRNARLSTGPKSEAGRARAALAATRHGLAARYTTGSHTARRVGELVDAFIGDGPRTNVTLALASVAAESQVTVERVEEARAGIYERTQPRPRTFLGARARRALTQMKRWVAGLSPDVTEIVGPRFVQSTIDFVQRKEAEESVWQPLTEAERQAMVLQEAAALLIRLDRYQRRALSRRRRALNDLEELRTRRLPPG